MKSMDSARRGSVTVLVAFSMVVLAGFAAFAVDYGFLLYKRSQLQTAADMGALAGVGAVLSFGEDLDRARDEALLYAQNNLTSDDQPVLAVGESDIVFLRDGVPVADDPNEVEATVSRDNAHGNPVSLFLGAILGQDEAEVGAVARAELFCSSSSRCLKPWSPPAKFTWDDECDPKKKNNGNGKLDSDSQCEVDSVNVLGYGPEDVGVSITLEDGDPLSAATPGQFGSVDYPPVNKGSPVKGGTAYEENIVGCAGSNNVDVAIGDELLLETGNKVGKTSHGVQELIDQDSGAYWDSGTKSVRGSAFDDPLDSPRVVAVPFYDPRTPPESGRETIFVYQIGGFFIESLGPQATVTGRFMGVMAVSPTRRAGDCEAPDVNIYGTSLTRDSSRGG